jgi:hypothetical protein
MAPNLRCGVAHSASEAFEVALNHRLKVGVHHDRAGAFVLAELGEDPVRDGKGRTPLCERLCDGLLIRRVREGKQQ